MVTHLVDVLSSSPCEAARIVITEQVYWVIVRVRVGWVESRHERVRVYKTTADTRDLLRDVQ